MKLTRIAAFTLALGSTAFAQGLPSMKVITVDLAESMAQAAMAKCRADGYKVTVMVVDHANMMKALLRDDGAGMATIEVARMKNNSVMSFGRPSGPPPNLAPGAPVPAPVVPGTINAMGGVPVKVGDTMIGSIAVSGAPGGDKDASCANAGLAKVADKLR
ncbi:MAG TPA: heme-binding protein [Bryobacteraceae bacterium]|nr:heme-binding protein [Bryobacteraceae bacterium]